MRSCIDVANRRLFEIVEFASGWFNFGVILETPLYVSPAEAKERKPRWVTAAAQFRPTDVRSKRFSLDQTNQAG